MIQRCRSFRTQSPEETARFAEQLGAGLTSGDTILLKGPVGAGKTHFARSLIRSLQTVAEDVPSPTYTLVQTYDSRAGDIWHADLYRLSSPDEVSELGLEEAFSSAICLVEWPDALGGFTPPDALTLTLLPDPGKAAVRDVVLHWTAAKWTRRIEALTDAG